MTDEELLGQHRCAIGGAEGIQYIFTANMPGEHVDIDIVTRCETASRIVEAGWNAGMFRTYPLLIVGGGAAGITAALMGLSLGIEGIAIANDEVFFRSQRNCSHRYLHPRIYRWPAPECKSPGYTPPRAGLSWTADYANLVVAQWDEQTPILFEDGRYQKRAPVPDQHKVKSTGDVTRLIFTENQEQEWGMVLLCIAPRENTSIGNFTGTPFWHPDDLENERCGSQAERPRVLVCGSGDGALQDFLRICCPNTNIQELYELTETMLDEVNATTKYDIRSEIAGIAAIPRSDFDAIHVRCGEVISRVFSTEDGRRAVSRFVERACAKRSEDRSVELVCSRDHFQKCYLLNRFLALLVGSWHESIHGEPVFVTGAHLTEVSQKRDQYQVQFDEESFRLNGEVFDKVVPRFGVENLTPGINNGAFFLQKMESDS